MIRILMGLFLLSVCYVNYGWAMENFTKINAHSYSFKDMKGEAAPLSQFAGKVVLIVNTASKCGFAGQYKDLQELYLRYQNQGFVVIAVPSNDFGEQEPGSAEEIQEFCETNFKITFPIVDKVHVKGDDIHPFYQWAAGEVSYFGRPKWNFHKYLIGKDGRLVDWFSTATNPLSENLVQAIEEELNSTH